MKYVKSKNLLIACTLSAFLVQTTGSVYSPAAKPAKLAKPLAKSVAKHSLKTMPPVKITIPVLLTDIYLGTIQYHSTDSDHSFIDALNRGETFTEIIQADGTLTLKSSSTLAKGQFPTNPSQIYYKCAGDFSYKNITVNYGATITIQGTNPDIPTVHITIPGQLKELILGNKSYTAVQYKDLFAAFNRGAIFTGVVDYMGDLAIYSKESYPYQVIGSITDATDQISYTCTEDANYTNTKVSAGTSITIQVINAPPPPETSVTFTTPANVIDVQLNGTSGYSNFLNKPDFIAALNTGATFTGTIEPNGSLTLTSTDKSKTFTGTFNGMPKNILYIGSNDLTYTASNPATYGTEITIKGTNAPPPAPVKPVAFTIPANVTNITLVDVGSDFSDKTALISALNKGQTFTGTITNGGALTLTNADKSISSQGVFLNSDPKGISYQCSGDKAPTVQSVTKGATVTITGSIPPPPPPEPKTVTITIPAGTIGIGTVALGGDKGIEDISAIFSNNFKNDLLTADQTVTGTVTATNIAWKSTSGVTLNTGYLSGGTIEMFAFYTSPTDPSGSVNHTVTAGDTIKIVGIKAPPVTITIPANLQLIEFGKNTNITDLSNFLAALNNGETFTGTIDSNKTLTLKSATSATTATGTFWTLPNTITYECTADIDATSTQSLNVGTKVIIIGTKTPPPVTITIPSNVSKILLGGTANSFFDNPTAVITAINKGETLRGTINSKNVLTLGSATNAKVATGTFVTKPNQISYQCVSVAGYTNIPVNPGTFVTITLNKTFTFDLITIPGFTNFTDFSLVTASGKHATSSGSIDPLLSELSNTVRSGTIYGKCSQSSTTSANGTKVELYDDSNYQNLLATFSSTETVAWIEWTTNNKINSDGKLNLNILYIAQQNGTFKITINYPPATTAFPTINPFITIETQNTLTSKNIAFNFFSTFNKAVAISSQSTPSNQRKANLDNPAYFLQALSDYVSNAYDYIGNNNYAPLFNAPRYIYCKFSNNGATLQLYKDQALTIGIGTFSLLSPQNREYIYKLSLHTDAYISTNNINDLRIGSDGYVNFVLLFDENIALNNGSITIELINPNDSAYKTLSQITDFTGLAFSDTNNNKVVVDKVTTDRLNVIYNCKDNQSAATGKNCPLMWQATNDNTTQYDSTGLRLNYYSYGYNPSIAIDFYGAASHNIQILAYYNIMWVGEWPEIVFVKESTDYQEETRLETYPVKLTDFANISNITTSNLHSLQLLQAPITTQQRLFYFNHGYNPNGGPYLTFPNDCICSDRENSCNI